MGLWLKGEMNPGHFALMTYSRSGTGGKEDPETVITFGRHPHAIEQMNQRSVVQTRMCYDRRGRGPIAKLGPG